MKRSVRRCIGRAPQSHQRRGLSLIWMALILVVLIGFVAMAIDIGRVRLARTELQVAADAAARAAAWKVKSDIVEAENIAVEVAAANQCRNQPIVLNRIEDIEFGTWNRTTRTFTLLTPAEYAQANAVRVTARRIAARSSPIPMTFASVIGVGDMDVSATAIAYVRGGYTAYEGIVGIDWAFMNGNPSTDSYNSTIAPYDPLNPGDKGTILSNGEIELVGTLRVNGDAHPGIDQTVSQTSNVTVTGSKEPLVEPLEFNSVDPGPYVTTNDNADLAGYLDASGNFRLNSNASLTLTGGTYYVHDFYINGTATLTIAGPCTFYITGSTTINGTCQNTASQPSNFRLEVVGSGDVMLSGTSAIYGVVYAPDADVVVKGTNDFYGGIVGKTFIGSGTGDIHYDESIKWEVWQPYRVALVK